MVDPQQIDSYGEQVVLSACYSARRWFWGMALILLASVAFYAAYFMILRGHYVKGICGVLAAPVVFFYCLDQMLTKLIIFYPDRVVKVWHLLGRRTIYYSRAKVTGASRNWQVQRSKWYQITEIKDNGGRLWLQIPILYGAQFVPPDTAKKIDVIIDYLTDNNASRTRIFEQSFLPIEVISRSSPNEG